MATSSESKNGVTELHRPNCRLVSFYIFKIYFLLSVKFFIKDLRKHMKTFFIYILLFIVPSICWNCDVSFRTVRVFIEFIQIFIALLLRIIIATVNAFSYNNNLIFIFQLCFCLKHFIKFVNCFILVGIYFFEN